MGGNIRFKILILTIILFTFTLQTKASSNVESWDLGFSLEDINVYYTFKSKGNKSIVSLKFVNESNSTIEVEWDEVVAFSPDNIFQLINSNNQKFVVSPGTSEGYHLKKQRKSVENHETISHLGFKNVKLKRTKD